MTTAVEHQDDPIADAPPAPSAEDVSADSVTHLARCTSCDASVKFQPSASGASFIVLDTEIAYGISPNGLPMCPNGHGEMTITDEQLPADEAFALASAQLQEPQQAALPGVFPTFNYQGAFEDLVAKAKDVERLKADYDEDKARASESKKAWEKAAELLTKMGIELDRRRREKAAVGDPIADLDPSRCAFEQLHPDTSCPLCSATDPLPFAAAPKDAAEHAQQAEWLIVERHVVDVEEQLEQASIFIPRDVICGWTDEERDAVNAYASALYERADPLPERPAVLRKNHVAGPEREGEPQVCTQCDAVIAAADDGTYPQDALVGTTCPGKPVEANRYPKRHGAKKTKKSSAKKK